MKKYLAEFIGTFALVLVGTGSIVANDLTHGAIGNFGIALSFGLIVCFMILLFGKASGAHLNPAVTLGLWAAKIFPAKNVAPYLTAQLAGALTASFLLKILFPSDANLGATHPSGATWVSFVLEFGLTLFLMLSIILLSITKSGIARWTPFLVGLIIFLEAYFAGPFCGASMNPARSLAPALASQNLTHLWIYLVAPISGSLSAVFTQRFLSV